MTMRTYGYCRVSSIDQNADRQLDAMKELNIPKGKIFIDKQSGRDFNRPAFTVLLRTLKPGDLLYIKSIDRLGRNYIEIQKFWRVITKEIGADINVIEMPILDTRTGKDLLGTFLADTVLAVLSFVAENEHENIRKRQAEGIKAAKARGVVFGRPIKKVPCNFGTVVTQWERGQISFLEALDKTGLRRSTFYNRLKEYRKKG